jgi:hypothetical protein
MSLLDMVVMIAVGGIAACAQIMWANGDANRLGEIALWAVIVWAVVIRPAIVGLSAWSNRQKAKSALPAAERRRQAMIRVLSQPVSDDPVAH